ncbi:MAG TPA: hypothetical protein VJT15_09485 [Pyrinomonadaceae bacterium]|nr:hypothetical protein [Pyrinomonadaceae bacterium]
MEVSAVAVTDTGGSAGAISAISGANSAWGEIAEAEVDVKVDVEVEADAEIDPEAEVDVEGGPLLVLPPKGVGAGSGIGLKFVVASTTI